MNQFKKALNYELQSISLSEEKKQLIAKKASAKMQRQKRHIHWQYRFVLTAFTLLLLSFGYLLWQQGGTVDQSQGAAPVEPETTISWTFLSHDLVKVVLLIILFVTLRLIIKRRLDKRGKGLPVCLECGEEWTFREASKQSWKNGEVTCPNCAHKQYRTKKSALKMNLLNIPLIFMFIAMQLFDNFLLGIVFYLPCAAYLMFSLIPYFMDFQETDPMNEFWGDEK